MGSYLFSSEAVADGHPDKICDQVADALLDHYLRQDRQARVACEVLATKGQLSIPREVSEGLSSKQQREQVARDCLRDIGCLDEDFHWKNINVSDYCHDQNSELAWQADQGKAGDQGIMFGYATDETAHYMPAPIYYAQAIMSRLRQARRSGNLPQLLSDGKCQVTVRYQQQGASLKPRAITALVLSLQQLDDKHPVSRELIEPYLIEVLPDSLYNEQTCVHLNAAGDFVKGGPSVDTGLTGRKIVVDTYGAWVPNGGGSFSGKDGTKVDRSGAYMARYLAKNLVAAGLAQRCEIQIAYGIALKRPVSVYVNSYGTGKLADDEISKKIMTKIDLSPAGIIAKLQLDKPNFQQTAWGGHFGHEPQSNGAFAWEKTNPAYFSFLR